MTHNLQTRPHLNQSLKRKLDPVAKKAEFHIDSVSCLISCNLMLLMNFTSMETGKALMAPPPAHVSIIHQTGRLSSNLPHGRWDMWKIFLYIIPVFNHQRSPLQGRRLRKPLSCETDFGLSLVPLTEKS